MANLIESLKEQFFIFLQNYFNLDKNITDTIELTLNTDSSKEGFGDLSSNAALILSKELRKIPRQIAQEIKEKFNFKQQDSSLNLIDKIEIAGPGFINIFLNQQAFQELANQLYEQKDNFFKLNLNIKPENFSIEFVSANPTGPLYLSHGRGGILGDTIANILKFLGHKVTKEFYINDAGRQIQKLGESFQIRCLQGLGQEIELPEDSYRGEFLVTLAKQCIEEYGQELLDKPLSFFENYAKEHTLKDVKDTLSFYGIDFDIWFSEKSLHDSDAITKALSVLKERGYLYNQDDALWFKSTLLGDDKDRVLQRANGEYTYFAPDIAYLLNKINRGYSKLVMTLGQDHHSYVVRLKAALEALGCSPKMLDIILYQLVTLKEGEQVLRMSKRAGRGIYLRDVIETVGRDVARFFYLNKKADAHLEFDLELALKKTDENPVYYIQYAYVRTNSILQKAQEINELKNINIEDTIYLSESENILLKKITYLQTLLNSISKNYQVHLLSYYAIELAQLFHSYYGKNKVIDIKNINQSRGRLLATKIINQTLKTCFDLLGISAPEKM